MKRNEYLTFERGTFYLWLGHPKRFDSSRIDVTMAVKIGMRIGASDATDVESILI